jgi:hypothetical protein
MTMRITALLVLLTACATSREDKTVCTEYRETRCLTKTICSMDQSRGCQVCRCEAASVDGPDGRPAIPVGDQR